MSAAESPRVGILVPCRNEGKVIRRRLQNLARLEWPAAHSAHRLLVIDDHSTDETAELARAALDALPAAVQGEVLANRVRPGKNGAIEQGVATLGQEVDLILLTDADVLVDPGALHGLCQAFATDPKLGMACGTQSFVQRLDPEGRTDAAGSGDMRSSSEVWDRWTARVRRLETRFGKLFSVHGQWLAWRASLGLIPRKGVAADDIDLMLQVRSSPTPRVRMIPEARFFECKPPAGEATQAQGLRRARAWFQVFDRAARPPRLAGLDALQWWAYSRLPAWLPAICFLLALALVALLGWSFGPPAAGATLATFVIMGFTPFGREWRRTFGLILRARQLERREPMPEAWEMGRDS